MPIIITAKTDNFRRCDTAHSKEPQTYATGFWPDDQLAILRAEPMLMVQELPDEQGDGGKKDGKKGK